MRLAASSSSRSPADTRDASIDIARGIGIILVVYGHLQRGFLDLGTPPHAALMRLCDFVLYTTHMPLFFLLAGKNAHASLTKLGPGRFGTSRLQAIVFPYLLWSTVFVVVQHVATVATGVHHPVAWTALLLLPVVPIGIFWFLQSLLLAQGIAMLGRGHPGVVLACALLSDTGLTLLEPQTAIPAVTQTLVHLPFFAFGFLAAAHGLRAPLSWRSPINAVPTALGALGLALIAVALGCTQPVDAKTLPISCLGIATIMIVAQAGAETRLGRRLASIGRASMPIYVLHIFLLPLFMRAVRTMPAALDPLLMGVGPVFGVVASLAVYRALAWAGLDGVLGLSGLRKRTPRREGGAAGSSAVAAAMGRRGVVVPH